MRALKTLLILLLALLGLFILLGLMGPGQVRVERSVLVPAPTAVVFDRVGTLAGLRSWGPWQDLDKDPIQGIQGVDGAVGSVWSWSGDTLGDGRQEVLSVKAGKEFRTRITFSRPRRSSYESIYAVEARGDSTRVLWTITGENDFTGRLVGVFVDVERMVGPDMDRGLVRLSQLAVQDVADRKAAEQAWIVDGFHISEQNRPAQSYFGERRLVPWAGIQPFLDGAFARYGAKLRGYGIAPVGPPTGLYYGWNEDLQQADMMAAWPVPAEARERLAGNELVEVPAGAAYVIDHRGAYTNTARAHRAMDRKLRNDRKAMPDVVLEEYVTDPRTEADTSRWQTRVIYPVR